LTLYYQTRPYNVLEGEGITTSPPAPKDENMKAILTGLAVTGAALLMTGCAVYPTPGGPVVQPAVAVAPAPVYYGPPAAVVVAPRPYYYGGYGHGYYGRRYYRGW
jgi:hypothetical protein